MLLLLLGLSAGDDPSRVSAQSRQSSQPVQLIPRTKEQREQIYKAEHRISVVAQVTDSKGTPITGLISDDFKLLDNQRPQKISEFRELGENSFAASARVVVVLDGINDGGSAIGPLRKDLDRFLSQGSNSLRVPLSLAFVGDVPKLLFLDSVPRMSAGAAVIETQPTTDRASVRSSLKLLARHSHQIDCLTADDGASQSYCQAEHTAGSLTALMKILEKRRNNRAPTFLIWVGRGWPLVSERRGYYRDWLVQLNADLRLAHVILCAVSRDGFVISKRFPEPLPGPGTPDEDAEMQMTVQALAISSGGLSEGKVKNLATVISKVEEEEARGFYCLSFDSAPSAKVDEYRPIQLEVKRPNAMVRTSAGYYAQP
ncbi:MAG TPA: hypothetical protein VN753_09035 [Terracidiphilus sp.]|nr:hypothetical protein [Terracidiphilus sp.]